MFCPNMHNTPTTLWPAQQLMPNHVEVLECCQHIHHAAVLEYATQPGLFKTELPLDHPKRMLHLGAEVRHCKQKPFRLCRSRSGHPLAPRGYQLRPGASLGAWQPGSRCLCFASRVASQLPDSHHRRKHFLLTVQELSGRG
jgi:hypothetical protein